MEATPAIRPADLAGRRADPGAGVVVVHLAADPGFRARAALVVWRLHPLVLLPAKPMLLRPAVHLGHVVLADLVFPVVLVRRSVGEEIRRRTIGR